MKHQRLASEPTVKDFELSKSNFLRWTPIFNRLGLRPRKYFCDKDEIFVGTVEGWFRLSFSKYSKQELKWVRNILEYLEERSFNNWAVPWQKTIIWEENTFSYLIQPWLLNGDFFKPDDPASIIRVAEILADFHKSGKDYQENKGIKISRDRWSTIEPEWEISYQILDQFKNDFYHEKIRPELNELRKEALPILSECLTGWKTSGITSLLELHLQAGVVGHGNLLAKYIIWGGNDYFFLNWEHLSFQPRVADLACLIIDVAFWEPEWILFFINEYAKVQPFWPEEYTALFVLLRYPRAVLELMEEAKTDEFDRKKIKEVAKEMARKERCLAKVWRELGSQKRWAWNKTINNSVDSGRISMVLSPVESWGDFSGQVDSLIQVRNDHKLPSEVIDRLTYHDRDRVVGGREGNILQAGRETPDGYVEIVEEPPKPLPEQVENIKKELKKEENVSSKPPVQHHIQDEPKILQWSCFPKPIEDEKKIGVKRTNSE